MSTESRFVTPLSRKVVSPLLNPMPLDLVGSYNGPLTFALRKFDFREWSGDEVGVEGFAFCFAWTLVDVAWGRPVMEMTLDKCPTCGAELSARESCKVCAGAQGVATDSAAKAAAPVIDYQRISVSPRIKAKFLWISMIVVAVLAFNAFVILLFNPQFAWSEYLGGGIGGTPFSPATIDKGGQIDLEAERQIYWLRALAYLFLFLLTQWLFLTPRGSWRIKVSTTGPLPRRAALAAGFVGMLLATGFIATFMEIPDWWIRSTTEHGLDSRQHFGAIWILMGAMWAFWSVVFYLYLRGNDRYSSLARIFRWLLAGTVLELIIAWPAHAIILHERGDKCYCERGTWTGVAFGCTAAFWLFGPGAALLMMREVRRREQLI
jgi:hypothetical protein